jgi:phosphate starvation-inducible PhoH-like protein
MDSEAEFSRPPSLISLPAPRLPKARHPIARAPRRGALARDPASAIRRNLPLSKRFEKQKRRNGRAFETAEIIQLPRPHKFATERALPPIKPLNATQADYLDALRESPQVVVLGPAGTGKTWIAATFAADLYRKRRIAKIILTRPNVPCGRSLGFFPGSLEEKFAPWAAPIVDAIKERIGAAAYEIALKKGDISVPLGGSEA